MGFHHMTYEVRKAMERKTWFRKRWVPKVLGKKRRLKKCIPILLGMGLVPYCCNGKVTALKYPCKELECGFKWDKKNVAEGCCKCESFQFTLDQTGEWEHAILVCEFADVVSFKGDR